MPLVATPATLSPHGTYNRAAICSPHCAVCAPKRKQKLAWSRNQSIRETQASRESKRKAR